MQILCDKICKEIERSSQNNRVKYGSFAQNKLLMTAIVRSDKKNFAILEKILDFDWKSALRDPAINLLRHFDEMFLEFYFWVATSLSKLTE